MLPKSSLAHTAALCCKMPSSSAPLRSEAFVIHVFPSHCSLSLVPREHCPEWTGLSCSSSWNIVTCQQAGFTSSGLGCPDLAKKLKCEPCTSLLSSWESSDIYLGCLLHLKWFLTSPCTQLFPDRKDSRLGDRKTEPRYRIQPQTSHLGKDTDPQTLRL